MIIETNGKYLKFKTRLFSTVTDNDQNFPWRWCWEAKSRICLRCNLTEPSPKSVPLFCRWDITLNLGQHVPCRPSSIQLDENRVVRAPGYRHLTASVEAGNDTNKGILGGLCSRFEWSTQYRNALSLQLVMKCTLFCERGKKRGKSLRLSEHFSTFSFGNAQKSFNKS